MSVREDRLSGGFGVTGLVKQSVDLLRENPSSFVRALAQALPGCASGVEIDDQLEETVGD